MPLTLCKNKPRWTRRKDARPQELLAAALDLFVERGYAMTRLEDVAAQAGVSKGTLYLYFANKEELFKAVVRENMIPELGGAEEMLDGYKDTSVNLFRDIVLRWWKRVGNTKLSGITKLMISESSNFPEVAKFYHEEVISRANGLVARILKRGIERGEFREMDVIQVTHIVTAPLLMLMVWKHSFTAFQIEPISAEDYLNSFFDLFLNGLLRDAPVPPN